MAVKYYYFQLHIYALTGLLLATFSPTTEAASVEQKLVTVIQKLLKSNTQQASEDMQLLIDEQPDYKLAQLVHADLLYASANPLEGIGGGLPTMQTGPLVDEAVARWNAHNNTVDNQKIPLGLVQPGDVNEYALAIDLSVSRLYLIENRDGVLRTIRDYYISMGRAGAAKRIEGDLRTPLGIYFVQSYRPGEELEDKYGAGAYPINYPNAWDRQRGLTGSGIWLHGTESGTYSRPPLASEGCVVLSNSDLVEIEQYIKPGYTPVLIQKSLQWVSADEWNRVGAEMNTVFDNWKNDWESLNAEKYLMHYSNTFTDDRNNGYEDWAINKKHIADTTTSIDVMLDHVSVLLDAGDDVVVFTFMQKYKNNNFTSTSWVRQYWKKEPDGIWRIIFEGAAPGMS